MKPKWLLSIFPLSGTIDRFEKMRACAGALFGLVVTGLGSYMLFGNAPGTVWMIAPMGASAVLLFGVPASPLAQPWSVIGGNMSAALIGVTCAKLIGIPLLAAAFAVALAIAVMFALRCLHPPSGAIALTTVVGGPDILAMGYEFAFLPVAANSLLLLSAALFFNNATGRRYPHMLQPAPVNTHQTTDLPPTERIGMMGEDLDIVLKRYNQVLDISRDDLEGILLETERQVYMRRHGVTHCADVMSRDVVSVAFATPLKTAWDLLYRHRILAMPVVDRGMRVVGIITKADFIRHARLRGHAGLSKRLLHFLQPVRRTHSVKPEVVGQIMHKDVRLAREDQPIVELVQVMSDGGVHAMPVVDARNKLVGMITQSDMIAALYESGLQPVEAVPEADVPAQVATVD